MRLDGLTAMVTGGTGGIGGAIAQALRNAGADVLATGLGGAEVAAAEAGAAFQGIRVRALDVADDRAVTDLVDGLGRLDILVNGAGMIVRAGGEFEVETFQKVIEVNLTGAMRLATACRPLLARRGGAIVNIASMLSFFGSGAAPAYSASKGGIAQLTKSLAIAWASDGIRVNAVAPGWIETALTGSLREDPARSAAIVARTPLGRWGRPEDIGGAVVFLCSGAAAFVTGVVLPVDGGYAVA
ncbi:MAG TPA: SDR family oxidoreductase [Aliidongia sp.]|uniref:SDR family NAD(P)-dependent oxidoreductase n=1 Tax=Aliidongia sp. TaxID=1914230 RepID=UPI002DDD1458|nr:SDR family oxidoreductase [Aliidongia sp.]HEV2675677.1 SDR family oxidoreductase [Aliidongia sp.]